jgi:hypothetical protein
MLPVADESAPYGLTPFDRTTGVFEVRGVLPGSYDVIASFGNFHGRTTIQIGSADLDNVRVALLPDFEINMQVKIENAPPNTDVSKLQARLDPDYSGPARRQPSGMWQWRPAWAATPYRVSVDQLPENTYLKSARLGDLDLLTTPMRFDRSPGDPVEIVLGLGSTISGTIANTTLEPGTTALVALIPDEARRGRSDLYKSVQTDTQGRFRFAGVAPGDYVLLAWENVEEGAWRYPDFIRRYEDRAKTIHVDENSNPTIQLSVIP